MRTWWSRKQWSTARTTTSASATGDHGGQPVMDCAVVGAEPTGLGRVVTAATKIADFRVVRDHFPRGG
jgi:hypothetical protein